jgi:hypothetical protein
LSPRFQRYTPDQMETMSVSANEELQGLSESDVSKVADWWKSWFLKVGHKRLGRALIKKSTSSRKRSNKSNTNARLKFDQVNSVERSIPTRMSDSTAKYRIISRALSEPVLFSFESNYPDLAIVLNKNHPMYASIFAQISREMSDHTFESRPLLALLTGWSYVESQNQSDMTRFHMQEMRYDLSRSLANGRVSEHVEFD